ncbi:uncharacterized protein LOC100572169 [Acyrthosiphon pisum]|uniref:Uncharacterized protein n=1 Tax=Acyrthosiphon pisum TaxID=7029 RepID=A0A8R2JLS6_ACYPI|nr:uncharacterized protein LOC100572169 [Acyrthosiphon pisum]
MEATYGTVSFSNKNTVLCYYFFFYSFMSTTFNMDTNYWDTLAINELFEPNITYPDMNIIKCLSRYNAALLIVDTNEMWNKYVTTMVKLISDAGITEIHKLALIKVSIHCAHKKKKLTPSHYIHLIYNSKGSMTLDFLDWGIEAYPNDTRILEVNINFKLTDKDELIAYELFKENAYKVSSTLWLIVIKYFLNKPQIWHIFNMAFGDESVCCNEVKKKLAKEYLLWLSKNKSLNDARNAYLLLNTNNSCDASLCKTMVNLENRQQIIDVSKIREHFTLACMQFGKTNIG